MADVSIIISTNADQASKEIKGLSNSVINASDKALKMAQAFDFLDRAFNKGRISSDQYQSAVTSLDASEDALYASIGKTTQAVQEQSSAAQAAAASVDRLADEAEMLSMKYKAGYAAGKQLSVSTKELNTALKLGVISAKQHKLQIAELGREYQRTGKYSKGFSAMQRMAGKSTNKFGMYSQQVGYQVGDFAVQVQSGTNALVAFGQQGTQLAGLLPGLAGAVLGIGLAIGTAVARSVMDAKKMEINFKGVIAELKKPLRTIKPILDAISGAFKSTGNTAVSILATIANNLDRVVLIIAVAATALSVKLVGALILAKVATFSLTGAFKLLRKAIIRTGIGVLIIGVAEVIRVFLILKQKLGGLGPTLELLKKAFFEVLGKIALYFKSLRLKSRASTLNMKADSLKSLKGILDYVNKDFVNGFIRAFMYAVKGATVYIKGLVSIFVEVFKSIRFAAVEGINTTFGLFGKGINYLRKTIKLEPFEFKPTLSTEGITQGDPLGVFKNAASEIMSSFKEISETDYVGNFAKGLDNSIVKNNKDMIDNVKAIESVALALGLPNKAIEQLVAAYSSATKEGIDFNNMLQDQTDADKAKSENPIAKLDAEIALKRQLLTMTKEQGQLLVKRLAIEKELNDKGIKYDKEEVARKVAINHIIDRQIEMRRNLVDFIDSSMEDTFMKMVDGTTSVKDAFKSMASDIIKELYRVLVVQEMVAQARLAMENSKGFGSIVKFLFGAGGGVASANGNVFSGGDQVTAYADGGVVNGPTNFPMNGNKVGLMGEAGPEAIMPLKRGANGKLGVQAEGGGDSIVINQAFNFQANGDDSVKKLIAQAAPRIAELAKASVIESRRRGGSTKAAFN